MITERDAATSTSLVGGQGEKKCGWARENMITKANRWCSSLFHGEVDHNCTNHPRSDPI